MRKDRLGTVIAVCVACIATIIRVVLAYKTAVCPGTDAVLDDGLFIDHANAMRHGDWLGPYGEVTLAKNPGYSIVMAAFRLFGLRYQLGLVFLLVLACAVAAQSLRPLVPSRVIRLALYVALLYLPAFFTSLFFQRVYRNGVAAIFSLLLFSSFVGLYLRRKERLPLVLLWSLMSGLSLGLFSIIQESASWVLPFVGVCTLVMLALTIYDAARTRLTRKEDERVPQHLRTAQSAKKRVLQTVARMVLLVCPVALYACTLTAIQGINANRYGVALLNDKYHGEFARATANIMSIDVGCGDQRVWVSSEALNEALKASPTLSKMEPQIREVWPTWESISADFGVLNPNDSPQVLGDHPYWALRSAYAAYGGYEGSAPDVEAYWGAVANELEDSFATGALRKKDGLYLSATTQPMPYQTIPAWVASSAGLMCQYAWGSVLWSSVIRPLPNTELMNGSLDAQMAARDLLGSNTLFTVDGKLFEDRTSEVAQPWLTINNVLGNATLVASKVILCMSIVGAVVLLILDVRTRNVDGARSALIIAGLCLSSFVLVFGASWMISFISSGETALSAANPALSYCGAVYVLVGFIECLVLGRIAQMVLDRQKANKAVDQP